MYEYARKIRRRGMYGLGVDDPTPGQQLLLDYRAGAKTASQVETICRRVTPMDRLHSDYDECRWFLDPGTLCQLENGGRWCSREQIAQQCFMTPSWLRNRGCASYMEFSETDERESDEGPAPSVSLRQATGTIAQYRERVAQAAENIVRTLRAVDPQVQALQQAMVAAGCALPRYGADGRWGAETEAALQCFTGRQGWPSVLQQYPWVAQHVTVPAQAVASAKPAGSAPVVISQVPAATSATQTASILPAFTILGLPPWATWAVAGLGLVSIIAIGAYFTRGR